MAIEFKLFEALTSVDKLLCHFYHDLSVLLCCAEMRDYKFLAESCLFDETWHWPRFQSVFIRKRAEWEDFEAIWINCLCNLEHERVQNFSWRAFKLRMRQTTKSHSIRIFASGTNWECTKFNRVSGIVSICLQPAVCQYLSRKLIQWNFIAI